MILDEDAPLPTFTPYCVVGSGPVGMAVACGLASREKSVVLLESGLDQLSGSAQDLAEPEFFDPKRHAPSRLTVVRALGGASRTWGGRCVPFDPIDFAPRPKLGLSGWPLSFGDASSYYEAASRFLGAGAAIYSQPARSISNTVADDIEISHLERWSHPRAVVDAHRAKLRASSAVRVHLGCTAVGFTVSDGHLSGIYIRRASKKTEILRVGVAVLACGGLENARLLLHLQAEHNGIAGGQGGALGRYYMGHISGKIATIIFDQPAFAAQFDFLLDREKKYVRRRFTVPASLQLNDGLLNFAAFPENPPFSDPSHRNPLLSLAWLALATPPIGRRLVSEAIRLAHVGAPRPSAWPHVANLLKGLPSAVCLGPRLLYDRLLASPAKPGLFLELHSARYRLHYHAEQLPNASSRVVLGSTADSAGLRRLRIDLRFSSDDADSIIASHELIQRWLQQHTLGKLDFDCQGDALRASVLGQATDGFHQIGLTRMASNERDGVVDADGRVFGINNLFIAGSSIFPTSSQANPTLLAVALAFRLASRIA